MLKKDIIFIGGMDWDDDRKLPPHHVATRLARNNRVFYIDNFGAVRDFAFSDIPRALRKASKAFKMRRLSLAEHRNEVSKITVWRQMVIPTPRLPSLIGRVNAFLLKRGLKHLCDIYGIKEPVIWTRVPTQLVWRSIESLPHKMLVYQSVDKFPYTPKISESLRPRFVKWEKRFCMSADLVFASARGLFKEKKEMNPNTYFFPNGVDTRIFRETVMTNPCKNIKKPIIGFAGALGPWVDYKLILETAQLRPTYSFVLLGPLAPEVDLRDLGKLPNVHLPGVVKYLELPAWYRKFDVGLIPYRITKFTNYTFPTKMAEYLAVGLPVISTPLPEIIPYSDVVSIIKDPDEMATAIDRALSKNNGEAEREKRMALSDSLSWDTIVAGMEKIINERYEEL